MNQAGFDGVQQGVSPRTRVPMAMHDLLPKTPFPELRNRRRRFVEVYGRLKPAVTLEAAKAGLQPLFHQILQMEVEMPAFAKASNRAGIFWRCRWMRSRPRKASRNCAISFPSRFWR